MKALSLTQPWATLVASGSKKFETRSWNTQRREQIAIHAAKGFPKWCRELCESNPFATHIRNIDEIPVGKIIAVATLSATFRTEDVVAGLSEQEKAFGDYSPGRFAWQLDSVIALSWPIQCKGALSLWQVPPEALEGIMLQISK